jgi:hypothetical protein
MTKTLIGAALVGFAFVVSAPAQATDTGPYAQELREKGIVLNPFVLPSEQLRRHEQRIRD